MTSSWLASFVLIVVLLGLGALVTGGVWVLFFLLARWDRLHSLSGGGVTRYLELAGSPAPRAARGTRS